MILFQIVQSLRHDLNCNCLFPLTSFTNLVNPEKGFINVVTNYVGYSCAL